MRFALYYFAAEDGAEAEDVKNAQAGGVATFEMYQINEADLTVAISVLERSVECQLLQALRVLGQYTAYGAGGIGTEC